MYPELPAHDGQRCALLVPFCGPGNGFVSHLPDHAPSRDAGLVEVVDHRRSVQLISAGKRVDRGTLSVVVDQLCDLCSGQSSLDRV